MRGSSCSGGFYKLKSKLLEKEQEVARVLITQHLVLDYKMSLRVWWFEDQDYFYSLRKHYYCTLYLCFLDYWHMTDSC
jgi:hypothetical protein